MPDFIYITTLNGLQELYIVKPLLQEEGIRFYIKNENMIQMNPLYANATGGLDVMVESPDAQRAYDILKEAGYIIEEIKPLKLPLIDIISESFHSVSDSIVQIKNHRLFKHFGVSKTLIGLTALLLTIVFTTAYVFRNKAENVMGEWCVVEMYYNNTPLQPHTIGYKKQIWHGCEESVMFISNGYVYLPGIGSKEVVGDYIIEDDEIVITQCDTLEALYKGTYDYEFDSYGENVTLASENMVLYLHKFTH